jgi:hydantoinase/carbamoylase family amidase
LEVLRVAPKAPVELVVFAEEEGTTFNLGMIGSRTWAGTLSVADLRELRNRQGQDYLSAGAPHGVSADRIHTEMLQPGGYQGLIEAHVEQGPSLWKAGKQAAVVTSIAGRKQYLCTLTGEPNHAGATRMADRRDALTGAACIVSALESLGRELDRQEAQSVITVGRLEVLPNSVNVVPGTVRFTIDMRGRSGQVLSRGDESVRRLTSEIAEERQLLLQIACAESLPPVTLDAGVCERLCNAAGRLGIELSEMSSGALHDSAVLAPLLPAAMLFVASRNGISHNPAEFSRIEDIACAARIVAEAVSS